MKMELTECSETSAQNSDAGESPQKIQLIICVTFYSFNRKNPLTTIKVPHQRFMLNLPNEISNLIFFIRIIKRLSVLV
jgi:hypothetical protein